MKLALPLPKIRIEYDEAKHLYLIAGKYQAPSVTRIIEATFPNFFFGRGGGVGGRFSTMLEAASNFGHAVHAAVHYDLESDLDESSVTNDVMGCVRAARKFCSDRGLVPVAIETPVASLLPLYAGRFDTLMVTKKAPKRYWLIDWKTGIEVITVFLQLEAYCRALKATYGIDPHYATPVYLDASGSYSLPKNTGGEREVQDYKTFLAAHTIWKWRQDHKETV